MSSAWIESRNRSAGRTPGARHGPIAPGVARQNTVGREHHHRLGRRVGDGRRRSLTCVRIAQRDVAGDDNFAFEIAGSCRWAFLTIPRDCTMTRSPVNRSPIPLKAEKSTLSVRNTLDAARACVPTPNSSRSFSTPASPRDFAGWPPGRAAPRRGTDARRHQRISCSDRRHE